MTSWKTIGSLMLVGAATVSTFGGCTKEDPATNYPAPGASQGDEPPPAPATENTQKKTLDDRQIMGILATVDAGEIAQARGALNRASDPRVKQFAAHMIEQHTESTQKASTLASQYDLMPSASKEATALQDKGAKMKSLLDETSDSAFDATYMKAQIQEHQEVLNMLHSQLMPSAENDALVVQLRATHNMVQNHLNEAREIGSMLHAAEPGIPAAAAPAQNAMPTAD